MSDTTGWQRHDLRRTTSSVMERLQAGYGTIDRILGHKIDHEREGTSRALDNYLTGIDLPEIDDPQRAALCNVAKIYDHIEAACPRRKDRA